jgi:membrane-associated phospholipid phosphatase
MSGKERYLVSVPPSATQVATLVFVLVGAVGIIISLIMTPIMLNNLKSDVDGLSAGLAPPVLLNASCLTDPHAEPRRNAAYALRVERAFSHYAQPVPCHPNNGDEALYEPVYFSQFTKGMPHDNLGHVVPSAYQALIKATHTWVSTDFDAIPQAPGALRDFTNPQAGLAYVLQGADGHSFYQQPAPAFASAEQAGEMVENYWMAYLRDLPFHEYATDATAGAAAAELGSLSIFKGPSPPTGANLFRGTAPGCDVGPYISQFLYMPCAFGANYVEQTLTPPLAGLDFMTNWTTYLAQQRAQAVEGSILYNTTRRHIYTGRDLSHWVHVDVLFQAYFHAMLILLDKGAPLKAGIPYQVAELNQMGFGTFGGPDVAAFATISATSALKSIWFQKWMVHRRLRPEVFAARVHSHLTSAYAYPIHTDALSATIVGLVYARYGSYLLPQAFPEGSPLHPSYGAGHATVAGAAVTILKALFQEDWVLPNPVMPNPADEGQTVIPLSPPVALTVGGELNKLAANIGIGRNIAGVHWRSDATESFKLGEQVAIQILKDIQKTYHEPFGGFTFTNFDGVVVQV